MSTKSISSQNSNTSSAKIVKPIAPPVSRVQTNLSRSAASSNQSLHSSTSETQSQSTVKTAASLRRSQSSNEILTENIDDFALADRVWVNGQRPGHIRYLGDTQFAPGKWAGIELETEDGKNDGSVAGVRYFECKAKYGVFVRPQRLTRQQIEEPKSSNKSSPSRETVSPLTPTPAMTDKLNSSLSSNKTNGNTSGSTNGSHYSLSAGRYEQKFSVGDRVLVNATSGTKLGTLQYLGAADFAPGRWAGIELDEPVGKNDGSVAGKRYFKCEMKYGLFAPIHKISAAPLSALKIQKKSAPAATGANKRSGTLNRQKSSGSRESLNSIASSTASSTRPRVRLGVTSLSSAQKGSKTSLATQVTTTQTVLNDVIKEKEDHISQLLKERDLERGEVARAAAQADQLEDKLSSLMVDHQKLVQEADEEIQELKRLNQEYEEMQIKLSAQLDDERKKLEDLQFRLEEETIMRSELESQTTALKAEIERLKQEMKSTVELRTKSESEQVDTLEEKLKELENKRENDMFALQEELVRKEEAVLQLEVSIEKRDNELANCQKRLQELELELDTTKQRTERQIESIDELNLKIKSEESVKRELSDENKCLRKQLTECEKRLLNLEEKLTEISAGKSSLEQELDSKESAERLLEETLMETKVKYEKFETEVHSLAAELAHIKSVCDQEIRRRKDAEERVEELSALNRNLELKVEELMRTSGTNSDLLLKINTEVMDKQREFQQKERQLKQEIETVRKEKDQKSEEMRVLSIELEDKKSLITRFEKKQKEFDKNIQLLENDLKLTRSDCDEKQTVVSELRREVNDLKLKLNSVSKDQEMSKGQLEYKLKDSEKQLALREQELETSRQEFRELRDKKFELELERDRLRRDTDRLEKTCEDRQQVIDGLKQDLKQMREEFDKYKRNLEKQLEVTKVTNEELKEIGTDLDRQKKVCQEVEEENQSLKDDNRHLREKVEELRDDIEALEKRHREVLTEFEYECERLQQRAISAETLAEDKQRQLLDLEEQQAIAFEAFRRQAEVEKRQLEQTLNDLEIKVRESISANTRRYASERETDGTEDNYEQQIEFLNSVIVDMQKKNDELRNRVQVLEEIGLDEFDSSFQSRVQVNGHIRAPRMFCDICDVFDAHETEDCPQQANIEQDTSSHTYYHAIRTERRPYCDHCERFGHNNNECPDTETF